LNRQHDQQSAQRADHRGPNPGSGESTDQRADQHSNQPSRPGQTSGQQSGQRSNQNQPVSQRSNQQQNEVSDRGDFGSGRRSDQPAREERAKGGHQGGQPTSERDRDWGKPRHEQDEQVEDENYHAHRR
jgi:hypothetical protein